SAEVEKSVQSLSTNFQTLQQNSVDASGEIKKVAQSAQNASKEIKKWASETTNSVSLIKTLFSELEQLANYIISSAKKSKKP
ncbi:MAG: hypothetical protein F6K65_43635, partial [Moorea sp. SIO3C2]|nr:hypothetical protein [Moorena sp. SIO3C2]